MIFFGKPVRTFADHAVGADKVTPFQRLTGTLEAEKALIKQLKATLTLI
jgi:hypothetical protein